jgi:hypothetical protein
MGRVACRAWGLREGGTALRTDDLSLRDLPLDLTLLVAGEVKGGTSERKKEGQAGAAALWAGRQFEAQQFGESGRENDLAV